MIIRIEVPQERVRFVAGLSFTVSLKTPRASGNRPNDDTAPFRLKLFQFEI